MQSTTQEETLNTKADYERFVDNHGIKVCWYYAKNGRYAKNISGKQWGMRSRQSPSVALSRITKTEF